MAKKLLKKAREVVRKHMGGWRNGSLYYADMKHLIKLSPMVTWNIKNGSNKLLNLSKEISRQEVA